MSVMDLTIESISRSVEAEVPEIYLVIAKNSVAGLQPSQICELLGCSSDEMNEVLNDQTYKSVRLLVAAEYAKESVEADFSWDSIEGTALRQLGKRVGSINDTDQLLRIAAVANKAQRRHRPEGPKVLDPSLGGSRVALTLTQRIVDRLGNNGNVIRDETRQISVTDGSASNPTFNEIDKMLGVSARPQIAKNFKIQTHEADFAIDDLEYNK